MIYLSRKEIILLDKILISSSGGHYIDFNSNLLNPNSLDWLVKAVKEEYFGTKKYRNVFEVASAYCFFIINDHIFNDGNKRTGTEAALFFLEKNGYLLKEKISHKEIEHLALSVENKKLDLKKLSNWFKKNTSKRKK